MIQPQYQLTYISSATTTTIASGVNVTVHTVVCPIATTGTVTLQSTAGSPATYCVLPIGSIGTLILDSVCPNGLAVVTSAGDKVIVTTQTP
jgi:L-lactate utilization protein LutC